MMSDVVIVKVGTSSVTTTDGEVDSATLVSLAAQVAELRAANLRVVVVTSGAITAGWSAVGRGAPRPADAQTLQAVSAVGQPLLMDAWRHALAPHGLAVGQVLLAPHDFADRSQYLHARGTIESLWSLGVVPVVNENDAVADEEIRFGDNDRLAALVASLVGASTLVLLTDTAGLLTADPRFDPAATLIAEIETLDDEIMALAAGSSSGVGSGGMTSKLSAARIAQWSGVTTIIAPAREPQVLSRVLRGEPGLGTTIAPRRDRLSARKAWIAFALPTVGRVVINDGAATALISRGSSLLGIGILECVTPFVAGQALDVMDANGERLAKGVARVSSDACGESDVVVHRDELVVLK